MPWWRQPLMSCFDPRSREGSDGGLGAKADPDSFDPRSREGSDPNSRQRSSGMTTVSIRAPAKGATPPVGHCHTLLTSLFRSALPRRERPAAAVGNRIRCNQFRSALPRRERPAPSQPLPPGPASFRSALPRRERPRPSRYSFLILSSFDPRSREGSDPAEHIDQFRNRRFDPRSREGSDRSELVRWGRMFTVSIRAPAKGATPAAGTSMTGRHPFRSALPRRERPSRARGGRKAGLCFDPRSREGSDPFCASPPKEP